MLINNIILKIVVYRFHFQIVCQILFVAFIILFIVKEARKCMKGKKAYFKDFWNFMELTVIGLSIAATVLFISRLVIVNTMTNKFSETNGMYQFCIFTF